MCDVSLKQGLKPRLVCPESDRLDGESACGSVHDSEISCP